MTHKGFRLRLVLEHVVSVPTTSADPRESFEEKAITVDQETVVLDADGFAAISRYHGALSAIIQPELLRGGSV